MDSGDRASATSTQSRVIENPHEAAAAAYRTVTQLPSLHSQSSYVGDRKCLVGWTLTYLGAPPCVCEEMLTGGLHIHPEGIPEAQLNTLKLLGRNAEHDPVPVFSVMMNISLEASRRIAGCFDNELAIERFKELFGL